MELRPSLSAKARRTLLRGGVLAALATAKPAQTVEAQGCETGVILNNPYATSISVVRAENPYTQPGNRRDIGGPAVRQGDTVTIKVRQETARDREWAPVTRLSDGRFGIDKVLIWDGKEYVKQANGSTQYLRLELPCGVYENLDISQISTAHVTQTPTPERVVVIATPTPTARVETPTPTPTARVETPTPTHTPVVHTPTPTHTPVVHTPTPTETPNVVTATPTPTSERPTATATPALPPTFDRDRGFWEGVWCVGPIAVVGLGAAVLFAATRGHDRRPGYIALNTDEALTRRQNELLDRLREELVANLSFRSWSSDERAAIARVNATAAAAPALMANPVGSELADATNTRRILSPAHRGLLDQIDGFRERLSGGSADATAVTDAKRESEEAREAARIDATQREEAFRKTKTAEVKRRDFARANPDHPLPVFDAETQEALRVTGVRNARFIGNWRPGFWPVARREYY